jgi:hypothetical protein
LGWKQGAMGHVSAPLQEFCEGQRRLINSALKQSTITNHQS